MLNAVDYSENQYKTLCWWKVFSPYKDKKGIICDGAIRSGKTFSMSISFILWAFSNPNLKNFAICGKSLSAIRRNVLIPVTSMLEPRYSFNEVDENKIVVTFRDVEKTFYLLDGRSTLTPDFVLNLNLDGVFFDEVVLLPRPIVEQVLARCSNENSKYWFTCNPESPFNWFYNEWVQKVDEKNILYIKFTIDDNPSLSEELKTRYKNLYSGAFYERFIEGKWSSAEGLVYPMFCEDNISKEEVHIYDEVYVSCDYGTVNPFTLGLWVRNTIDGNYYRIKEFYWSSREQGQQLTDEEYYLKLKDLLECINPNYIKGIIIDPCAASFIETVKRHNEFHIIIPNNVLIDGINAVANAFLNHKIYISSKCHNTLNEISTYRWDNSAKQDHPIKANDHCMDDIRYFVMAVLS